MTLTTSFRLSPSRSSTQTYSSGLMPRIGGGVLISTTNLSLVARGTITFDQPPGTSCDSSGSPAFRPVSARQDNRSLHGQYDSPVVCQEARGDVLHGAQPGGATSSPFGRVHGPVSGSPIYRGSLERCDRLPEPSSPCPRLGVDLDSGGCGQVGSAVAGNSRSFRLGPQLPAPGVFLSPL